jgi:hypothetical protein
VTDAAAIDATDATGLDAYLDAIAALEAAGAWPGAIIVRPEEWARLTRLRKSADSLEPLVSGERAATDAPARSISGVPLYLSETASAGRGWVLDPRGVVVVRRQDVEVAVDQAYQFDRAGIGIRVLARLEVVVPQGGTVAVIDSLPVPAP